MYLRMILCSIKLMYLQVPIMIEMELNFQYLQIDY